MKQVNKNKFIVEFRKIIFDFYQQVDKIYSLFLEEKKTLFVCQDEVISFLK